MIGTLFLALVAGALTMLNPCVLPVLPIVLLGALDEHRLGPLALAAGMVASFTLLGLLIYGAGDALDLSGDTARNAVAVLMLFFGIAMLSSALKLRIAAAGAAVTAPLNTLLARFTPRGLGGQFLLGALLGGAWSPCTGPTLGSAVTLAAQSETLARAASVMLVFGIGAVLPMAVLAYGSRRALLLRRAAFANLARMAMPVMGALLVLLAIGIFTGAYRLVETVLTVAMPEWLVRLTTRF